MFFGYIIDFWRNYAFAYGHIEISYSKAQEISIGYTAYTMFIIMTKEFYSRDKFKIKNYISSSDSKINSKHFEQAIARSHLCKEDLSIRTFLRNL